MTIRRCFLFTLTLIIVCTLEAQIPSGYYRTANGLTGEALKAALNDIIDGHKEYSYNELWALLQETDRDPDDPKQVIGIYSRFSMNAAAAYDNGNGWNREHVWAKSRGDFGTSNGPGTDLHHIRAEDVSTNSARNNRAFATEGTPYVDRGGSYHGATPAREGTDYTWYPGDAVRGDIARMLFYMAVRYEGEHGEPDLELTNQVLPHTDTRPIHGVLSDLLQWHLLDPVSEEEKKRNEVIYHYQGNRNPFIDHPEYAAAIWGAMSLLTTQPTENGTVSSASASPPLIISEYVEGSSNNKAIELTNTSNTTLDLAGFSLKKQINGKGDWSSELALTGSLPAHGTYVIVNSSADPGLIRLSSLSTTSSIMAFNGNDPVGLFAGERLIDVVGKFNGGEINFAQNTTLRRQYMIHQGSATYEAAEWQVLSQDTFDNLGKTSPNSSTK